MSRRPLVKHVTLRKFQQSDPMTLPTMEFFTVNGNLKALSVAQALRKMLLQTHNFLLAILRVFVP